MYGSPDDDKEAFPLVSRERGSLLLPDDNFCPFLLELPWLRVAEPRETWTDFHV